MVHSITRFKYRSLMIFDIGEDALKYCIIKKDMMYIFWICSNQFCNITFYFELFVIRWVMCQIIKPNNEIKTLFTQLYTYTKC